MMASTLMLVVQHWIVIVREVNYELCCVLLVGIDVIFQWTVISNLQHYDYDEVVRGFVYSMLVAHWMFLLAGVIETSRKWIDMYIASQKFKNYKMKNKEDDVGLSTTSLDDVA